MFHLLIKLHSLLYLPEKVTKIQYCSYLKYSFHTAIHFGIVMRIVKEELWVILQEPKNIEAPRANYENQKDTLKETLKATMHKYKSGNNTSYIPSSPRHISVAV